MICPIYLAHGLIRGPTEGNGEPAAGRGFGPGIPCSRGRTGALPRVAVAAPVGTTMPRHAQPVTLPASHSFTHKTAQLVSKYNSSIGAFTFHSAYLFPACVAPFIACETANSVFACPRSLLASLSFRYRWPHHRDLRGAFSFLPPPSPQTRDHRLSAAGTLPPAPQESADKHWTHAPRESVCFAHCHRGPRSGPSHFRDRRRSLGAPTLAPRYQRKRSRSRRGAQRTAVA